MGSQLAPFGTSSQPFNNSVTSFGLPSGNQPFAFSAQPQAQTQPPFGFGPGIASGSGYTQSQQAPFTFGQPPAGGFSSAPQGMGMGMGHSMIDPVGGGGGGGFSMGAADPKGRRKVKAKRPGGGP